MLSPGAIAIIVIAIYLFSCINILKEWERGVILRLGRVLDQPKGPGLIFIFKPLDTIRRVSLQQEAFEVPPQDIITRDNVTLKVNPVIFMKVVDPRRAVVPVDNYRSQPPRFPQPPSP